MGLSCKILRDKQGNVEMVQAPNGEESLLFNKLLNKFKDSKVALNLWSMAYTIGFKNENGDWEANLNKAVSPLDEGKLPNTINNYRGIFSTTTTGTSLYDDILQDSVGGKKGYFRFYKRQKAKVVFMSPEDYLKRVRNSFGTLMDENILEASELSINRGIENGDKIDMPYLSYLDGRFAQEGRNRAYVASKRGEKMIPVLIAEDVTVDTLTSNSSTMINDLLSRYKFKNEEDLLSALRNEYDLHRDALNFITNRVLNEKKVEYSDTTTYLNNPVTIETDINGEPVVSEVLNYSKNLRNIDSNLDIDEMYSILDMMGSTDFNNFEELYRALQSAFYKEGVFTFNRESLKKSGLYNNLEINNILNSVSLQKQIKGFFEKLELAYYNGESSKINNFDSTPIYEEGDKVFDNLTYSKLGKRVLMNPNMVKNTISKVVGGIKDRKEFFDKFRLVPLESIVNRFYTDTTFAEDTFNRYSRIKRIPSYRIEQGELEKANETNLSETISETLLADVDNFKLRTNLELLVNLTPSEWSEGFDDVYKVLEEVELELMSINVDVIGLKDTLEEKSQVEILEFIESLYNFTELNNQTIVNESQINELSNTILEFFNKEEVQKVDYQVVPLNLEEKTIIHIETPLSELDMFNEYSLLKVGEGLYHKINKVEDIGYLKELIYELVQSNPEIFPKEAYYPSAFNALGEFVLGKVKNENNKESIITDIMNFSKEKGKNYLNQSNSTNNNPDLLYLYRTIFNHGEQVSQNISLEKNEIMYKIENFNGKVDYLTGDFIVDFYNELLSNKQKNTPLYDRVFSKFKVTKTGINLISNDSVTLNEINVLSPSNSIFNNLRDYIRISKNSSLKGLYEGNSNNLTPNNPNKIQSRVLYSNRPDLLPIMKGNYTKSEGFLLTKGNTSTFIRTNEGVFEKINELNGVSVYSVLPLNSNPNFYDFSDVKVDTNFNVKSLDNLIETKENIVEVNEMYSKSELANINNRIDECGG